MTFSSAVGTAKITEAPPKKMIMLKARLRDLREIVRFSCQSLMAGPNVGSSKSLRCSVLELFAKHPAARSKNGVVGKIGRIAPSAARPMKPKPSILYISPILRGRRQKR